MGIRLIDEFLAKTKTTKCGDFRETADKIAKVGAYSSCVVCQPLRHSSSVLCCSKASGPS